MINIGKSLGHQQSGRAEGQGYFFCHPLIGDKFAEFLESRVPESVVH
jgi:hypothetical protein